MRYVGTRLREFLGKSRGDYTKLAQGMLKYKGPRKNSGTNEYNLAPLLVDGHNISLKLLDGLMKETGKPIQFFVDFEPGEIDTGRIDGISGSNNIINSSITNDLTIKVDHLNEVIRLKNELIADKERIITLKDAEIEQWKKRYDDLIKLTQAKMSDTNRT